MPKYSVEGGEKRKKQKDKKPILRADMSVKNPKNPEVSKSITVRLHRTEIIRASRYHEGASSRDRRSPTKEKKVTQRQQQA